MLISPNRATHLKSPKKMLPANLVKWVRCDSHTCKAEVIHDHQDMISRSATNHPALESNLTPTKNNRFVQRAYNFDSRGSCKPAVCAATTNMQCRFAKAVSNGNEVPGMNT